VTGLAPGTEYHARLVAQSSAGTTNGGDVAFPHRGASGRRPCHGGGDLARARRRPRGRHAGGLETQVWVEFGRGGALTARTGAVRLPASGSAVPVSFRLTGLQPGRRYGFRFVAAKRRVRDDRPVGGRSGRRRAPPRRARAGCCGAPSSGTNGPDRLVGTRLSGTCSAASAEPTSSSEARGDTSSRRPGQRLSPPGRRRDRALGNSGNVFVGARDGKRRPGLRRSGAEPRPGSTRARRDPFRRHRLR
jgi:hypothetical protein